MQTAQQQLRYRNAQVDGNVAWVGTESTLQRAQEGKTVVVLSTETMAQEDRRRLEDRAHPLVLAACTE